MKIFVVLTPHDTVAYAGKSATNAEIIKSIVSGKIEEVEFGGVPAGYIRIAQACGYTLEIDD